MFAAHILLKCFKFYRHYYCLCCLGTCLRSSKKAGYAMCTLHLVLLARAPTHQIPLTLYLTIRHFIFPSTMQQVQLQIGQS